METLLLYIVKVNIALAVFYLLYVLLLRNDTFIKLRRYYFLSTIIFSLLYPLFTVAALGNLIEFKSKTPTTETSVFVENITVGEMIIDNSEVTTTPIDWTVVAKNILLLGILFFSLRFVWQLYSIVHIKSRSEKKSLFGYLIYHLKDKIAPFSFFDWIFIHTEKHSDEELKQILLHEQTHVQQRHSIDVMLIEMVRILFWYNPVVWLMKRDITINLEYLADNAVLQEGINTREYQYHLLQLTYQDTAVQIVNNFNVSQLKQRIIMMNSNKSPMRKLAKYLSVLPLILLLITANSVYAHSNETQEQQKEITPPQDPQKKEKKSEELFVVVEVEPQFPGGIEALMKFLGDSIKYPADAKKNKIEGRVISNFVVNIDGSVSEAVIVGGIDPLLDAEALRVISLMPNWEPGMHRGEKIRVRFTLPIVFSLKTDDKGSTVASGAAIVGAKYSNKEENVDIVAQGFSGDEGKDGKILITLKNGPKVSTLKEAIYTVVEKQPEFPGGVQSLMKYLGDNIKYPIEAQKNKIEGRVITIFVVNKDGSLSDIKIERGHDPLLDAEAIRVIKMMPKWKPGTQKGEAVNVSFRLPIVFRLKGDEKVDNKATNKLKEKSPITSTAPDKEYFKFFGENLKYPLAAQENGIMGVSRATYDVNGKGEISNIKITESADPSLDAELIRVTKLMSKDIALNTTGGKATSDVKISVMFRLQNGKSSTPNYPIQCDVVVVGYGTPAEKK